MKSILYNIYIYIYIKKKFALKKKNLHLLLIDFHCYLRIPMNSTEFLLSFGYNEELVRLKKKKKENRYTWKF